MLEISVEPMMGHARAAAHLHARADDRLGSDIADVIIAAACGPSFTAGNDAPAGNGRQGAG